MSDERQGGLTPGEALAAKLDRIAKATPGNIDAAPESVAVYREWWQFIQETAEEARQALTASGVPYVPEWLVESLRIIKRTEPEQGDRLPQSIASECLESIASAGEVVVTTNEAGECVAVTRQDSEGQILAVIWERER